MDHLLAILKNARTDNEKMAALLLVGKLVQSQEIGEEGRRKVFEAVGFSFINRLLATSKLPEGCTENPYHKIALTILACFSTDADLVLHPQMTSKIPLFLHNLTTTSQKSDDDNKAGSCDPASSSCDPDISSSFSEDSMQCLQALSLSSSGRQHLVRAGAMEALANCCCNQRTASPAAKDLLLCLLQHQVTVEPSHPVVASCVETLAQEFASNQGAFKFDLCPLLSSVLASLQPTEAEPTPPWLTSIAAGLQDILTSRLAPSQREPALVLAAALCQLCGVEWSLQETTTAAAHKAGAFFKLLVHLASMELALCLEETEDVTAIVSNSSALLCSCFSLLEQAVVYVAKLSDASSLEQHEHPLTSADLLQLHTTLTEAFASVIHFLQTMSTLPDPPLLLRQPVVAAAVRAVGAWLAEESLVLSSDVCGILPFLLRVCEYNGGFGSDGACGVQGDQVETGLTGQGGLRQTLDEGAREKTDLMKFLLPGFCHMTAEKTARKVLLQANFHRTLLHYLRSLQDLTPTATSELFGRQSLCCEVLLNVCVCDGAYVKEDKTFSQLAVYFINLLPNGVKGDLALGLNASLLYLMVARRQGLLLLSSEDTTSSSQVLKWRAVHQLLVASVQTFLNKMSSGGSSIDSSAVQWSEVSELWFLTMQELTAVLVVETEVTMKNTAAECAEEFNQKLKLLTALKDVAESQAIVTAICSLLQAITSK